MKKVTINGIKVELFKEEDIVEKLGRTKEDWKLVDKYQKKFWQLTQNSEGFSVEARALWLELGEPYNDFSHWMNRKILKLGFIQDEDYKVFVQKSENLNGGRPSKEYFFTVDMGKHAALVTTNGKNKNIGKLVRDYFILMEKIVREYKNWVNTREPQKNGDKIMKNVLHNKVIEKDNRKPTVGEYCKESNLLNIALTGMDAQSLRKHLDMSDKRTRDHLTTKTNRALAHLQMLNTSLIRSGLDYKTRKKIIQDTVNADYKDIRLEIDKIKQNKAS